MKKSSESVNEELTEELTEDSIDRQLASSFPHPLMNEQVGSPPSLELGAAQVVTPASAPAPAPAPAEGAPLVASQSN